MTQFLSLKSLFYALLEILGTGRYGRGRSGEIRGGAGRCRKVQEGAGRCREVQGGAGCVKYDDKARVVMCGGVWVMC